MKQSLRKKSVFSIVFVIAIAFIVAVCICFAFSNRFYVTMKQRTLKKVYEEVNTLYKDVDEENYLDEIGYSRLSVICEENTISMLVITPSGTIDFNFGNSANLLRRINDIMFSQNQDQDAKIIERADGYILQSHMAGDKNGTGYVEVWGALDNGYIIIARSSYAGISNATNISLVFFLFVFMIIFMFVSILTFLIIKPYTDSLNRLLVFAQRANQGDFDFNFQGSKGNKNDEIGLLGANISEMSHKLEKTISELKTTNLRLENELKARISQDEARKKYMSDVSHELKTPIALISGYAEGIKEGISDSPEEREYYCDVIIDEAEKMSVMIKKLATLNQLENGKNEVILERFNLCEVIDGYLNKMAMIIEEKGANIYFDNKKPIYVWSDEFLVEETLMNYFNNAINHMDENKIIRINAEYRDDKTVRMTVFNSGKYIPEEEQDQIWGKFYKVDKARTRAYGGSGLGLSIVKAISESLGKQCGVQNVDNGVAFWIELEGVERPVNTEEEKQEKSGAKVHRLTDLPIWKKAVGALDIKNKKKDE